jgi:hypothetical protein
VAVWGKSHGWGTRARTRLRRGFLGCAQNPQVPATTHLDEVGINCHRLRSGGFTHKIGEGFKIIAAGLEHLSVDREPNHVPSARGGEPLVVDIAQVVTVRFRIASQRPNDSRGIGIHIRERRDCRTPAGGSRTVSTGAHAG